ncbi:MAG: hypothetical protein FWC77_01700 [Defluviitaleaceae bacterium]|nr:hypothetical protein [Defluviitaleaceae bacterium]
MKNTIMARAWEMYKTAGCTTKAEFAVALKMAWAEGKSLQSKINDVIGTYQIRLALQAESGSLAMHNSIASNKEDFTFLKNNKNAVIAELERRHEIWWKNEQKSREYAEARQYVALQELRKSDRKIFDHAG